MRCLYCRRRISSVRAIVDKEFCSSDHRKRFRTTSARVLRDAGELAEDYDDYLAVIQQPDKKSAKGNGKTGIAIAGALGIAAMLAIFMSPASSGPQPAATKGSYSLSSVPIGQKLMSMFPDSPKINLRQDFRMGMGDWMGTAGAASDYVSGSLKTDRLKLWKPSLGLSDYQMEFQASVERKAVGWAFRASDLGNYYATKIHVNSKDGSKAEVERFISMGGREVERVRLPIPVNVRPDTLYRVRVRVKGDQFLTSLDGQVIDMWKDKRLRKGGIGFFAEKGESASVRWVSLSEPESFLSRLFAFGFSVHPLAGKEDDDVPISEPVIIVLDRDDG